MSSRDSLLEARPVHPSMRAYKQPFLGLTGKDTCFVSRRSAAKSQNGLVTDVLKNIKSL